ncbi:MAG: hypothetical protein FJ288_03610 [Planctomycetes bacterium]|nr:hypothetical protein [Planctomycetota bacterium]
MRELEFLPPQYIRARRQRRVGFIRSWLLLAMGLAMVLWSFQMGVWVRGAQAELAALDGADAAVDGDVTKVRLLRAEAYTYKRRMELVRTLQQVAATEVIAAVADLLPEGVVMDDVLVDRGPAGPTGRTTLRLSGTAPGETAITQALAALEASPALERAVLVESRPLALRSSAEGRSFVVEVSVPDAQVQSEK